MSNEQKSNKAVINAEVDLPIKEAFTKWWKENSYATEAEAVRALVREKITEKTEAEKV